MTIQFGERDLDCELVFDRYLGSGDDLNVLQSLLKTFAPKWSSKLRLWRGPTDQRPIDVSQPGALKAAVVAAAGERGSTYRALVQRHGRPPHERLVGSAELRGAGPDLVLVVSIDEMVVSTLRRKRQLGNSLDFQVRRPEVEGSAGDRWLREAFEVLCAKLSPAWASAQTVAEYWAKVMSDPPGVEAIGRDFGHFLPGLFWLNFFGRRYRDLLGDERLRATPATRVALVDDGFLVMLATEPFAWSTPRYAIDEQNVRNHLGPEVFFSKADPERLTVAPAWDS